MSLNALVRLPLSSSGMGRTQLDDPLMGRCARHQHRQRHLQKRQLALVVEAKGKKAMSRQFQRQAPPPLPKIEDDGNPRFVIFIRTSSIYLWYPLSVVTGGTTAKIMVAAKDSFIGKYIYKDTIARNLAAVIYRDEKSLQTTAFKQFRVLRSATSFRYGYKLVENNNLRAALSTSDVIEIGFCKDLNAQREALVHCVRALRRCHDTLCSRTIFSPVSFLGFGKFSDTPVKPLCDSKNKHSWSHFYQFHFAERGRTQNSV